MVDWLLANSGGPGSVGVVTPFKAQAQAIETELERHTGPERDHRISVGTVHTFQGGERDVMLFSPVLAAGAADGTVKWIEDNRHLINVAVSRAQRALVLVTDPEVVCSLQAPTLSSLIEAAAHIEDSTRLARGPSLEGAEADTSLLHSRSEAALYSALRARGATVELKPQVEGFELDFALRTPDGPVDIECDGTQHADSRGRQRRQDLARDAIIERAGWRVLRYPSWRCLTEADSVADDIIAKTGVACRSARPST